MNLGETEWPGKIPDLNKWSLMHFGSSSIFFKVVCQWIRYNEFSVEDAVDICTTVMYNCTTTAE